MKTTYTYLGIGGISKPQLLEKIDKILPPDADRPFWTIYLKNNEMIITSDTVTIMTNGFFEDEEE